MECLLDWSQRTNTKQSGEDFLHIYLQPRLQFAPPPLDRGSLATGLVRCSSYDTEAGFANTCFCQGTFGKGQEHKGTQA